MILYKTVSAGNDFLHIDMEDFNAYNCEKTCKIERGEFAENVCRRHSGAGADGVVYYSLHKNITQHNSPSQTVDTLAAVTFAIFNRDGGEAELSGNGMAGVSAVLFNRGLFKDRVTLNTKTGIKSHKLLGRDRNKFKLDIEIGVPDFYNTTSFPFLEEGELKYHFKEFSFYPVSVGNPHVVVLLEKELPEEMLTEMGKRLECADIFPKKANVEFVFFKDPENCPVFYYERGVGRTLSSSTGSAAVFAVLQKLGLVKDNLTIQAGKEKIKISGISSIHIENSTKIVYKCIYMG
ncbi:MAG: diaminopimelate epimerase [bacterium]|nr:diaminopimelate epimerase [bacterium]